MINFDNQLKIFYSDKINDGAFFSGFGTKYLGDAKKPGTISNFFFQNNYLFDKMIILEQIHSANVFFYKKTNDQKIEVIEETDGVVTDELNTLLTIKTADCLPFIFTDKISGIIGLAHIGWRGSIKRLAQRMIEKMVDSGAKEENIIVAIGPGIGSCCYDVTDDRYYQFLEEFNGYSEKIFRFQGTKRYVDLTRLNYLLLVESGVKKDNIDFFPFCTFCDKARFYSFRRDKKEEFGEMFHFIIKKEEQELFSYYE